MDPRHAHGRRRDPDWAGDKRFGLHHAIIDGDTAYAAWRDAGMVGLNVEDRARPELVVHEPWSPPLPGGTHSCLKLPGRELPVALDEAVLDNLAGGIEHIWVFDNRVKSNPISISTFRLPAGADVAEKGARFGPHNVW